MTYEIKKNVPFTKARKSYPFEKMELGDMFELPVADKSKVANAANKYAQYYHHEIKFSVRKINETTYGCWRVK